MIRFRIKRWMANLLGVGVLVEALERIADEQKVYKGHGDYDIVPNLTDVEAQFVARHALTEWRCGE